MKAIKKWILFLMFLFTTTGVYALPISPIIPFGTTLPSECRKGTLFIDTDADTDGALYQCVATDTWKIVSGAGGGTVDTSGTPVALDIARFTDDDTIEGLSYAELKAAMDLEAGTDFYSVSAMDTLLAAKADESVVGTSLNSNDLVNTAGVLELQPEIPHTDEAITITGAWTLPYKKYTIMTSAPTGADKVVGQDYYADGATWNPCGLSGGIPYWVTLIDDDPTDVYRALRDRDANFYFATIETPTLQEDEWNDEAGDRLLTVAELKNKIISNAGLSADTHFDIPAEAEGWFVTFIIEAAYQIDIHPNDSADWYLNGTVMGADEMISNSADTVGESITCFSTELGKVYCESKYANFAAVAEPL